MQTMIPFGIFVVLSDIMIAGSLCYLLYGSRTGFKGRVLLSPLGSGSCFLTYALIYVGLTLLPPL